MIRSITFLMLVSIVALAVTSQVAKAQFTCIGQDNLDCTCQETEAVNIDICIGGTTYTLILDVCQQLPNPNLISNPCGVPLCVRPLNRVTWVKRICFPVGLSATSIEALYNGIICATDLCKSQAILGSTIAIPNCDGITNACTTVNGVYCHLLALPNCVKRNGNCWEMCDDGDCTQYCFVERRYCKDYQGNCSTCDKSICYYPGAIQHCPNPTPCTQVNCENLEWTENCCE